MDTAQLRRVIFGCSGLTLTAEERRFFAQSQPFGFILFARNIETPDQLRALCAQLRDSVGWNAPILIDQEGGRVQRMVPPHWTAFPPALDQAGAAKADRLFWLRGAIIGAELRAVGIDVNCTPNLDVARAHTHAVLQNRCYGYDAQTVIRNAKQMVAGQMAAGVAGVMKHIPGHGLASLDSHHDLPRVDEGMDRLKEDFAPFKAFKDMPMGMSAHIVFQALDPHTPGTQSPKVIDFIRTQIGFGGLLMTDDISMNALQGDVSTRSHKALSAGCDVTLHCNGDMSEMAPLADTTPLFDGPSLARANSALNSRPVKGDIDLPALKDEFGVLSKR
ncbi:MAG: beta-N-acetylhexosaminidase [Planktomarina sp.]